MSDKKYQDIINTPRYKQMMDSAIRNAQENFEVQQQMGMLGFMDEISEEEKKVQLQMCDKFDEQCNKDIRSVELTREYLIETQDYDSVMEFMTAKQEKNIRTHKEMNRLARNKIEKIPIKK